MATKFLTIIVAAVILLHLPVPAAAAVKGAHNRTRDWGSPEYAHCVQPYSWDELVHGYKDSRVVFKVGGLGRLLEKGGYETWQCFQNHYCAIDLDNPWFCFVYHETEKVFTPWGENSKLRLVRVHGGGDLAEEVQMLTEQVEELKALKEEVEALKKCKCFTPPAPFFNASQVLYPSSYTYPAAYATRRLVPVPGYTDALGTSERNYSAVDIPSSGYAGGVLAPNQKVYFVPLNADNVGEFDPSTREFRQIDITAIMSYSGVYKFYGGVLAANGEIIFVPSHANEIGILELNARRFRTVDISEVVAMDSKYCGGVLGWDNIVYFVPHSADHVGAYDPASSNFSTTDISSRVSGDAKYRGGVLAPNGLIYFVPACANNIGVWNPIVKVFDVLNISSQISGDFKYLGGILAPNGLIYFIPWRVNSVGVFDPVMNAFTTSTTIEKGPDEYYAGVLAPNGKIYFAPLDSNEIGEFDPSSARFEKIDIGQGGFVGGVVSSSGSICFVPLSAGSLGVFNIGNTAPAYGVEGGVPEAWRALLSPHFNKL